MTQAPPQIPDSPAGFPESRRGRLGVRAHAGRFEHWPDIGAVVAAGLAGKAWLQVGQPDAITPAIGIDHDGVRAPVVAAVDEQPARARGPHFPEGDFLFTHAKPAPLEDGPSKR